MGAQLFELGKVVGWLVSPLTISLALFGFGCWLVGRGRVRSGLIAGALALFVLWMLATPLVGHALAHHLERRFPALEIHQLPSADAIVLLGGALSGASPPMRPTFDLNSAADRVWFSAALYRAGKAPRVLVSGGNQPGYAGIQIEALAMQSMLLTLGVPASALRLEGRSRNTVENAAESLDLVHAVRAKRVLLVTSAMHMPRAMKIFQSAARGAGVTIMPASTDVEALPESLHPLGRWLPDAASLYLSTRALKEYLGLLFLFFEDVLWH